MQVDIQDVYHFATIDGNNRFGNVTDEDDISDLEAPTECEDEEKLCWRQAVQVKHDWKMKDMKTTTMTWNLR